MTTATQKIVEDIQSFGNEVTRLNGEIEKIQAVLKRPGAPANDNVPSGDLKAERGALASFIRTGDETGLKGFRAAMEVGSDPDGGYLVTPARSAEMTKKLFDDVVIRRLARVVNIGAGSEWVEPVDADESGATWVGETESRPETDTPQLKEFKVPLDEVYALQKVSQKLLDDSAYDIGSWVDEKITSKFSRSENSAFVSGDGVGKPRGFLTYATSTAGDDTRPWNTVQTVASGAAATVTADGIKNLYWSLRAPYRRTAKWLMSSDTANAIDLLKDGDGSPMWRNSMASGVPPTLLGLEVEFDEEMPQTEASALPIALADWHAAYTIVERPGLRMLRDNLTQKPHVLFYAYRRVGGGLANSEALKLLKIAVS